MTSPNNRSWIYRPDQANSVEPYDYGTETSRRFPQPFPRRRDIFLEAPPELQCQIVSGIHDIVEVRHLIETYPDQKELIYDCVTELSSDNPVRLNEILALPHLQLLDAPIIITNAEELSLLARIH